jgi:hypothetical protein
LSVCAADSKIGDICTHSGDSAKDGAACPPTTNNIACGAGGTCQCQSASMKASADKATCS